MVYCVGVGPKRRGAVGRNPKQKTGANGVPKGAFWADKVVDPERVLAAVEPGMSVFVSTGASEPQLLIKSLMASDSRNLQDLELIHIASFGRAISLDGLMSAKYRLKTFFSGWMASEPIAGGMVDLIPARFSRIPRLIQSGAVAVDAAFVQITPPDEDGYASLGISIDAARAAIERARLVVGEINPNIPRTLGDTFVHVGQFDYLVESHEDPIPFPRWPVDDTMRQLARNAASVIDDGACINWSIGAFFEALVPHLAEKKDLGVHASIITDALMDLLKTGAVTNRYKGVFRGKTLVSYALGTDELLRWLNENPLVEFQPTDIVSSPENIAKNDRYIAFQPARKVDLTGRIALHFGKGIVNTGPAETYDPHTGAALSKGGRTIIAVPSRNRDGEPNVVFSVEGYPNKVPNREIFDLVATEYGVAYLAGRTVRERALAIIEIAHPDDRAELFEMAKRHKLLFADQVFPAGDGHYPHEMSSTFQAKDTPLMHVRPIKPSDEDEMRRLFYRFSDQAVYYRYFSPIQVMPHNKMQTYVNIDYRRTVSLVVTVDVEGKERIVAEARYAYADSLPYPDLAFVVEEAYQGKGIATHLYETLVRIARERGIVGFTADVVATNKAMMGVFEKSRYPVKARLEQGIYHLTISFQDTGEGPGIRYLRD
ncbi:MAG: GNAT family N-acetyltransferase [Deltaproteobacteria bacterium]|nr:GNAT family N-acetyltransferase [Deltaproteobacteria bacterium]MCB9478671.1 GNAT family N-acetyltransferase [Deltaproteobacteria bacterium]MCB9489799.1 GNAT family N-acetyltransferase [Deltaproteobacteria bacterium]